MFDVTRSFYKSSPSYGGMLYAWFPSMHTRTDIILCGKQTKKELLLVVDAIYERLSYIEKLGNCYDADSELARLNRVAALRPQPVSCELYDILAFCMDCHTRTDGFFDITVHSENYTPSTISGIQLSSEAHTLFFQHSGININLSGFLKGYALESIRELLQLYGIEDALVNMGNSSILALGHHPLATGWRIGFEQGFVSNKGEKQEVLLKNECLTVSGNDSLERKHIIAPYSGKLIEGKWMVAVVTESGAVGEILSTAWFAADTYQQKLLEMEFHPRLILKLC